VLPVLFFSLLSFSRFAAAVAALEVVFLLGPPAIKLVPSSAPSLPFITGSLIDPEDMI
jgi:hypothetical protein